MTKFPLVSTVTINVYGNLSVARRVGFVNKRNLIYKFNLSINKSMNSGISMVLYLWLKFQRNTKPLSLSRIPLYFSVVRVYVGLPTEFPIQYSFINQSMLCDLHTKTTLLGVLFADTTTCLSLR